MMLSSYIPKSTQKELRDITSHILTPPKGILAADESVTEIGLKLLALGLQNNSDNRKNFREILFTTEQLGDYISAVILNEETLTQKSSKGIKFVEILKAQGIVSGVAVDKGDVSLFWSDNEVLTQGLDNLGTRCAQFRKDGARFAKWRCIYKIGDRTPSTKAIIENANVLARYAAICQANGLVPIVEPDVLIDGDHDLERCQKVTETVLAFVFKALHDHHVFIEGILLKTNMVTPGKQCLQQVTAEDIAKATVTAFLRTVPSALPGIGFLSGGQSEEDATVNLDAINKEGAKRYNSLGRCVTPWVMTFCFGRALQAGMWTIWQGKSQNINAAQKQLLLRAKANALAVQGKYVKT